MRFAPGLPAAAWLLGACAGTTPARPGPAPEYQQICPDGVRVFTPPERPPADYRRIAVLDPESESGAIDEWQLRGSQRRRAAALGANAIIVGPTAPPSAGGAVHGTGAARHVQLVAIYIPADSDRVREACVRTAAQLAAGFGSADARGTPADSGLPPLRPRAPRRPGEPPPAARANTELLRYPNLRLALDDNTRLGLIVGLQEVRFGVLRVTLGGSFYGATSGEYNLGRLFSAYREATSYEPGAVIELWQGGRKVGEYGEDGLLVGPGYATPR